MVVSVGIYALVINKKYYIGKDSQIRYKSRAKKHLKLLENSEHYNVHLQRAYNKYGNVRVKVLFETEEPLTRQELSDIEIAHIELYDAYNNGYNNTTGGEGLGGMVFTDEMRKERSLRKQGEKHHNAKLSDKDFFDVVEMLKQGKTNEEIGIIYNLHPKYVSLIRHKRRFKHLWNQVQDYKPIKSQSQLHTRGKVDVEMFKDIVSMIGDGCSNAEIERKHGLSSGTGSRIRHKKLYKQWWEIYFGG